MLESYPVFLGFVAVVNGIRGTGAYLLGRRESGFLKAFVSFPKAQRRYVGAQIGSCLLFGIIVNTLFGLLILPVYTNLEVAEALLQILRSAFITFVMSLMASTLNLVPFKFQTAYSAVTATFAPMVLLALTGAGRFRDIFFLEILNYFNPVAVAASILQNGFLASQLIVAISTFLGIAGVLATLNWFSIQTYWDK